MENSAQPGRKSVFAVLTVVALSWATVAYEVWRHYPGDVSGLLAAEATIVAGPNLWLIVAALTALIGVSGGSFYLWRAVRRNSVQLELQQRMIEQTSDAMMVVDGQRRILAVNPAFERITGYASSEVLGTSPPLLSMLGQEGLLGESLWGLALREGAWRGEVLGLRRSGEVYPKQCCIRAVQNTGVSKARFVVVFSDLSGQKAQEARIEYLLLHDPLTGLPNRLALEKEIEHLLAAETRLTLLIIDLDNFKMINDSMGHHAGDRLLQEVGERIRRQLGAQGASYRLGGDEFAVLLQGEIAMGGIQRLLTEIVESIGTPWVQGENRLQVTPSIGIGCSPQDGRDAQTLIRNTDTAMYAAKATGRNSYRFFADQMGTDLNKRMRLESELWKALAEQQLVLHYQPQYELLTGRHVGIEALVRWQHPELGMIQPADFVPLAEECGLILALGQWVLLNACRQAKHWLDNGFDIGEMAVNISPQQFRQPDFVHLVRSVLTETGLPTQRLELEITESSVIHDIEGAIATLTELRNMGIRLAIDDFGTGYSSLSYLRQFPVNRLKIDRAFVADVENDASAAALVSSIVAMGRSLGLEMVAEGVENEAQANFLRTLECERGQGFHFRAPQAADRVFPENR